MQLRIIWFYAHMRFEYLHMNLYFPDPNDFYIWFHANMRLCKRRFFLNLHSVFGFYIDCITEYIRFFCMYIRINRIQYEFFFQLGIWVYLIAYAHKHL